MDDIKNKENEREIIGSLEDVKKCIRCESKNLTETTYDEVDGLLCEDCKCFHGEDETGFFWEFNPDILNYGNKEITIVTE